MKKKIILLVVTLFLVVLCTGVASARSIEFENRTDFHWVELYIDYDGRGHRWGDNLLNGQVDNGESVTINVHGTRQSSYKIKIVERKHGQFYEYKWHNVSLEDAEKVIFHYNHRTRETSYRVIRR